MEMLLMGACLSMFGLAVACLAFGAATREPEQTSAAAPAVEKEVLKPAVAARALLCGTAGASVGRTQQRPDRSAAAADRKPCAPGTCRGGMLSWKSPNASLLHSRTISTLVN